MLELSFLREFGRDLDEELRLELGEVRERTGHSACGVVLGEPVRRDDERIGVVLRRVVAVVVVRVELSARVRALAVQQVVEGGLVRLVVRRQRPVHQTDGCEQPAAAVVLENEGVVPGYGLVARGVVGRPVVGRLVGREIGEVEAGPLLLLGIPPHVFLALGPRVALGIGGRAVVQDSLVGRPGPAPLGGDCSLLPVRRLPRGLILLLLEGAAVDPATARCRPVVGQLLVLRERLALGSDAVDLAQHLGRARLFVLAGGRVGPVEREDATVDRVGGVLQLRSDLAAEVVREAEIGAAILRRLDGFPVPLEEALRVREGSVLLDMRRRREEEDLRRDFVRLQLAGFDLRRVVPEGRALDLDEVAHDEPLETGEGQSLQLRVRRSDRRVLAEQEEALDVSLEHVERGLVRAVIAVDTRQEVEAKVVLPRRVRSVERPELADRERRELRPASGAAAMALEVLLQ